ncbi:hypothetical protein ACFPER_14280 [Agromyces aurantiacus]|uniref:Uncharacterized protein n=1 Tax=Agromyces aurantiacus TaxID=165814 RepID=A0ABV9RCA5_9MICO|nr:hypothetical protein [Agromyces aurantiacus]MBM7505139.1 hypothetical protein [Agromyces aurantiacus]
MFRRWRRARLAAQAAAHTASAPSPRATAADLRGEHIFELVNARLSRFIGPEGEWSLVRRVAGDSDRIFQAMLTHQIAAEVTRAILEEREQVAVVVPADEASLALSWTPAPLVVWADPVDLGETAAAEDAAAEAENADVAELAPVVDALAVRDTVRAA